MTDRLPGLGDVPAVSDSPLPERIGMMLRLYGQHVGERCGTCKHLLVHKPGQNRYYKCAHHRLTCGPGTDWRTGWPACGRWEGR